ncbi:hypothetical protein CJU90_0882 [Yarrowia sp. C11]|nr:hypothetical protein CKK34_2294 [Yarrowia sp. E02]KAG5373202.1 hypothetical protein CJU90_0882 [Yarrowia sp. C11]
MNPNYSEASQTLCYLDPARRKYMEEFLSLFLLDIWKPNAVKTYVVDRKDLVITPSDSSCLTVHEEHFSELQQKVWEKLLSINDPEVQFSEQHFYTWMHKHFGSLSAARLTLLRLTADPPQGPIHTKDYLREIPSAFSHVKVGSSRYENSSTEEHKNMRQACEFCVDQFPLVAFLDRFRDVQDEQVEQVMRYFGASYFASLTRAGYWANFPSMDALMSYLKEDESPKLIRASPNVTVNVRRVRNVLFQTLMKSMDEELLQREGYGRLDSLDFVPPGSDVMDVFDKMRELGKSGNSRETHDSLVYLSGKGWEQGQDNSKFLEYAVGLLEVQRYRSFRAQKDDYWPGFKQTMQANFRGIMYQEEYLGITLFRIVDLPSAVQFLQAVWEWLKKLNVVNSSSASQRKRQADTSSSSAKKRRGKNISV